ncbi:hypothetical protein BX616_002926 [Lobosporangium transversale]|nr:hypothetical protein BX616_002926 [Lobosporangium transversale]
MSKRANDSIDKIPEVHRKYKKMNSNQLMYSARRQFLLENAPFPDVFKCAQAFYNEFHFNGRNAANDALTRTLEDMESSGNISFKGFLVQMKTDEFRNWEKHFFQTYKESKMMDAFVSKQMTQIRVAGLLKGKSVLVSNINFLGDGVVNETEADIAAAALPKKTTPTTPPTLSSASTSDVFLQRVQFTSDEDICEFFFQQLVKVWSDISAFSKFILERHFNTACKSAFSTYIKSLRAIYNHPGIDESIRRDVKKLKDMRESRFRSGFFEYESAMINKALIEKRTQEQNAPPGFDKQYKGEWNVDEENGDQMKYYLGLLDPEQSSQGSVDDSFNIARTSSESSKSDSQYSDEDLTGEIPEPFAIDLLSGPGTMSSQLSNDVDGRIKVAETDINEAIMNYRRNYVIRKCPTNTDGMLLVNFIVTRPLLLSLFSIELVDAAFPRHNPMILEPKEVGMITRLCSKATLCPYEELLEWWDSESKISTSVIYRAVSNYFAEAGLWANTNWYEKRSGNNEDSFIHNLIRPLVAGAFGTFIGCLFRWSRDPLCSATDIDNRMELPDYQVSFGQYSFVLGEFKTATAPRQDVELDYRKLLTLGKRAVDLLFKDGYNVPVVLIHGRGMLIDIYTLELKGEAMYYTKALGTLRLISNPYEFSQLLSLAPLISAKLIASGVFDSLKAKRKTHTNKNWIRGTFDVKGVTVTNIYNTWQL